MLVPYSLALRAMPHFSNTFSLLILYFNFLLLLSMLSLQVYLLYSSFLLCGF